MNYEQHIMPINIWIKFDRNMRKAIRDTDQTTFVVTAQLRCSHNTSLISHHVVVVVVVVAVAVVERTD